MMPGVAADEIVLTLAVENDRALVTAHNCQLRMTGRREGCEFRRNRRSRRHR
jgi:hypothetical protein